jgi:L-threonylcarbamoyladenylate synthase
MPRSLLQPSQAAACLRRGDVIAYPTEAVFGLGCDPANERAAHEILALKSRPLAAGLILIGASFDQFDGWVGPVPVDKVEAALDSWPGPHTWLFPPGTKTSPWITGAHASVAVRVTAHPTCIALCEAFGGPIVSTSANPGGRAPARSAVEVEAYFGSRIAGIVAGDLGGRAQCSGIRDVLTGRTIREG